MPTDPRRGHPPGAGGRTGCPEATEAPASPEAPRLFTADLYDRYGYAVSVYAGRNGYYDAEDDGSDWEWEPETYVNVSFRMAKNDPSEKGTLNMVAAVARILAGRPEDAALVLNGNWLLLTRVNGTIRKSRRSWWTTYDLDKFIPHPSE